MIRDCGVNRLNQFATFLTQHLRNSPQNPRLLALVQTLDDALYSGLALPRKRKSGHMEMEPGSCEFRIYI
jgi:hypothetical protein